MAVYLETERLVLRRFTEDDVDNLVELDADAEVMQFINGGRPTPREDVERVILPRFLRYYEEGPGIGFWAADEKATGEFIGWFHFRPGHGRPIDEPELGYRLRRSAWGKGVCHRGLPGADRQGLRRARRTPGSGRGDGGARRLATSDGEVRSAADAGVPRQLARQDPRRRVRGRGDALDREDWERRRAGATMDGA